MEEAAYQFYNNGQFEVIPLGRGERAGQAGTYEADGFTLTLRFDDNTTERYALFVSAQELASDGKPEYLWIGEELYQRY